MRDRDDKANQPDPKPDALVDEAGCDHVCDNKVYHAGQMRDFTVRGSFRYAFEGIRYAFKTQRNFKIHAALAVIAILLGFVLQIDGPSWLAVTICIFCMFAAELINTSIESLVDLVSPGWSELAKRTKDCAAGAVSLVAIGSVVVAGIVYIPQIIRLISA